MLVRTNFVSKYRHNSAGSLTTRRDEGRGWYAINHISRCGQLNKCTDFSLFPTPFNFTRAVYSLALTLVIIFKNFLKTMGASGSSARPVMFCTLGLGFIAPLKPTAIIFLSHGVL